MKCSLCKYWNGSSVHIAVQLRGENGKCQRESLPLQNNAEAWPTTCGDEWCGKFATTNQVRKKK